MKQDIWDLPRKPGALARQPRKFPFLHEKNGLACLALKRVHTQKKVPVRKKRSIFFPDAISTGRSLSICVAHPGRARHGVFFCYCLDIGQLHAHICTKGLL